MRPRTNRVCIQVEVMRMQRHARIFGILVNDKQQQHGLSWVQAKAELKRELKNLTLWMI